MLLSLFADSPEYLARSKSDYAPPIIDVNELRRSLPDDVFRKSTLKGLLLTLRVALICYALFIVGSYLERCNSSDLTFLGGDHVRALALGIAWLLYWWWQGLVWASLWSLGA